MREQLERRYEAKPTWWAQLRAPNHEVMVSDRDTDVISNKKEIKMQLSNAGLNLIKTGEGFKPHLYNCPPTTPRSATDTSSSMLSNTW